VRWLKRERDLDSLLRWRRCRSSSSRRAKLLDGFALCFTASSEVKEVLEVVIGMDWGGGGRGEGRVARPKIKEVVAVPEGCGNLLSEVGDEHLPFPSPRGDFQASFERAIYPLGFILLET
jgi:hypothetical protein